MRGLVAAVAVSMAAAAQAADVTLLNVSYDPTRELYLDVKKAFAAKYKSLEPQAYRLFASAG